MSKSNKKHMIVAAAFTAALATAGTASASTDHSVTDLITLDENGNILIAEMSSMDAMMGHINGMSKVAAIIDDTVEATTNNCDCTNLGCEVEELL